MIAVRTLDTDLIKLIVTRPDMWEILPEDGHDPKEYEPDMIGTCWVLVIADNALLGAFSMKTLNAITIDIHAHMLPEYRAKYRNSAGLSVLKWLYDNVSRYKKVVTSVPFIHKHIKRYACNLGFQVEGVNRMSYLKNGEIVDQWMLGITRDEIGVLIDD